MISPSTIQVSGRSFEFVMTVVNCDRTERQTTHWDGFMPRSLNSTCALKSRVMILVNESMCSGFNLIGSMLVKDLMTDWMVHLLNTCDCKTLQEIDRDSVTYCFVGVCTQQGQWDDMSRLGVCKSAVARRGLTFSLPKGYDTPLPRHYTTITISVKVLTQYSIQLAICRAEAS